MWCKFPELKRVAAVWFLERVKAKYIQEVTTTMAKDRMTLIELLRKSGNEGDVDFLRVWCPFLTSHINRTAGGNKSFSVIVFLQI